VIERDLLLSYTPDPLVREGGAARTHYWATEWQAVSTSDDLSRRAGLPLGRYRFRVEGTGYELESRAFEVVPGALAIELDALELRVRYHAPGGFRLLDLAVNANEPAPLRSATVTVAFGGAPIEVALDGEGRAVIEVPAAAETLRVEDDFGNAGTLDLR
jgi:hypothetical protein